MFWPFKSRTTTITCPPTAEKWRQFVIFITHFLGRYLNSNGLLIAIRLHWTIEMWDYDFAKILIQEKKCVLLRQSSDYVSNLFNGLHHYSCEYSLFFGILVDIWCSQKLWRRKYLGWPMHIYWYFFLKRGESRPSIFFFSFRLLWMEKIVKSSKYGMSTTLFERRKQIIYTQVYVYKTRYAFTGFIFMQCIMHSFQWHLRIMSDTFVENAWKWP